MWCFDLDTFEFHAAATQVPHAAKYFTSSLNLLGLLFQTFWSDIPASDGRGNSSCLSSFYSSAAAGPRVKLCAAAAFTTPHHPEQGGPAHACTVHSTSCLAPLLCSLLWSASSPKFYGRVLET
ncbi:hypothetical protein ONS96_006103 [Cadophora gregata f. sp. sojae]|nr:hypothetical protein ONS96_006103 [Cadophora gregata f. sp. sojae]